MVFIKLINVINVMLIINIININVIIISDVYKPNHHYAIHLKLLMSIKLKEK